MLSDPPIMIDLGKALRGLREERNWRRRDLAARSYVSASNIGRVERGEISPTFGTLVALAFALDVPLEDVVKRVTAECARRREAAPSPPPSQEPLPAPPLTPPAADSPSIGARAGLADRPGSDSSLE